MRQSITKVGSELLGKRVMYRYSHKPVMGWVLAVFGENVWVEFDDGSDLERHYKSWELVT